MTRKLKARSLPRAVPRNPTLEEWEAVKAAIQELWIKQNLSLKQVQDHMKQQGFIARLVMLIQTVRPNFH